jgi:glycyl-tRNA synthetase
MEFSGQDLTVFKPYPEPKLVEVKRVVVDRALLGRILGSSLKELEEVLRKLSAEDVEKLLATGGEEVEVGGFRVPREAIKIVKEVEKVSGVRIIPHVAEPSFGAERLVLVVLDKAYAEEGGRVVLRIPKAIAPIKVAVFPLVEREELISLAKRIYWELVDHGFTVLYDESGSIGRRYARADEIGVPYAITVDFQSLEDGTVTIRDRDTRQQVRVKVEELPNQLRRLLEG